MRRGNDAPPNRRKRTAARVAAYPAFAIALAVVILAFVPGSAVTPFEQRELLFLLNALFLSAGSALPAGLAMFGYLRTGRSGLLAAGCGVLASGLAALFAAITVAYGGTTNAFVTVHNLGVLLASVMHLFAAVAAVQPRPPSRPDPRTAVAAYIGILVLTLLFMGGSHSGVLPVFFIPGEGSTTPRELVLTATIALMSTAAVLLWLAAARRRLLSLRLYSLGLALTAVGLLGVFMGFPGSVLSWAGRIAQYAGNLYLLIAVLIFIRSVRSRQVGVADALSDFFSDSADHYRALVQSLKGALISIDRDGRVFLWNAAAENIFGFTAAEAVGNRLDRLTGDALTQALKIAAADADTGTLEMFLQRRDGRRFAAEVAIVSTGRTGTSAIVHDVSERRAYEDALRRYELLARNTRDIILFLRRQDGRILEANDAASAAYGYTRRELLTMTVQNLRAPDTKALTAAQMDAADAGGILFETRHLRKDGSSFPVEVSSQGATIAGVRTLISVIRDITDRKQSEDTLRRANEQRRLTLESAEMGAWDYRLDTGEVFWDQRCRLMWGVPECDQISYESAIERIHPEDRSAVHAAVQRAIAGDDDGVYHQEFRVVWPDGSTRWIASHGRVFCRTVGDLRKAVRFIGANRDITRSKEIEAAAMESRREKDFVAEVVELSSQPFAVAYPDGRLGMFNEAFERLTGYSGNELRAVDWQRVLTPEEWHPLEQAKLAELGQTGQAVTYCKEYIRRGGSRVPVELLVGAARDSGGEVLYYYAFITDITERKRAEAETERSLQRLRILASTAADLLQSGDPRKLVSSICSRVMAHLGCEAFFNHVYDDRAGRLSLNACGGEAEIESGLREIDVGVSTCRCARERKRFVPERMTNPTDDPCIQVVAPLGIRAFACHPLLGDAGRVIGTLAFGSRNRESFDDEELLLMQAVSDQVATALVRMRDEQALRASERALQEANETLEQRVTERTDMLERTVNVLHREVGERRKISGELSAANRQLETRAGQLRALAGELTMAEHRERHRTGKVLHDHLQQLLSAARLQLSCIKPQSDGAVESMGRVEALLGEAIQVTRSLAGDLSPPILQTDGLKAGLQWLAKRMSERFRLEVTVEGREQPQLSEELKILIFESVRELLFNCAKHSGVGRAVVTIAREDTELCVTVSDGGAGFDPELVAAPGAKGTGFGLFGIRERLQLLGGAFEIESSPGAGSRFRLRAPLAAAGPAPAEAQTGPVQPRIRVLLADDHAVLREGLAEMLAHEPDFEIVGKAENGRQALELARRLNPDVVLMDIGMPRMDGVEATRRLKAEMPDVRVIGLSMLYEQGERAEAIRAAGAVAFVSKSAPAAAILAALRSALSTESSETAAQPRAVSGF